MYAKDTHSLTSTTTTTTMTTTILDPSSSSNTSTMSIHLPPAQLLHPFDTPPSLPPSRRLATAFKQQQKRKPPSPRAHHSSFSLSASPPRSISISIPSFPFSSQPNRPFIESTAFWLLLYFAFNLSLTLFNKSLLFSFPFPYTLTALHCLSSTIGTRILKRRGLFTPSDLGSLTFRQKGTLLAFSGLYTINIAVSNLSLGMVSIPFHQIVRSTTPLFTFLLSLSIMGTKFDLKKFLTLMPVVLGVGLATYGETSSPYHYTTLGFILTFLGVILASLKTILTNLLQTSSGSRKTKYNWSWTPLDILYMMSPLSFIQCVLLSFLSGELESVRIYSATNMTTQKLAILGMNGMIAFGLNVVSFTASGKSGAVTMTVAANIKQVLTIILSIFMFHLSLSPYNISGIVVTLLGGAFYAFTEHHARQQQKRKRSPVVDPPLSPNIQHSHTQSSDVNWIDKVYSKFTLPMSLIAGFVASKKAAAVVGVSSPLLGLGEGGDYFEK